MEIVSSLLKKKITERKLHNQKLLSSDDFFMESHQEDLEDFEEEFKNYIEGSEELGGRYIWATLFDITKWHIELGQMLALAHDHHEEQHLAIAAHYGFWWLKLGPEITQNYRNNDDPEKDIWLRDAVRVICYLLLTGHNDKAEEVSRICIAEIHSQFINGCSDWWLHPWFLIQLFSRWQRIEPDLSTCDMPKDMNIYTNVLASWDTQDLGIMGNLVNQMADFHLSNATFDMSNNETHDFDDDTFWFFPYEILAWLRIRELMGLPNPAAYEHPLMQQPLGLMPEATPFPEDHLLAKVVAKLKVGHGITD